MQAIFTNAIAKVMTHNRATVNVTAGQINITTKGVKETTGEVAYTVKNAMNTNNSSGKVVFGSGANTDTVFYIGKQLPIYASGETKWYVDEEGNISLEVAGVKYGEGTVTEGPSTGGSGSGTGSASIVAADPTTYYGEKVTNYETGNATIDNQVEWQIFHSDTNNIYLITTDYIHGDICPPSANNTIVKDTDYNLIMYNVKKDYDGSENITAPELKALNRSYHEYLTENNTVSKKDNMKAVAYMMDTSESVWGTFAGENANYAIGGPTVELLMESYSQKYKSEGIDYRAKATSVDGYEISIDGGENYSQAYSGILKTTDTQYVLGTSEGKPIGMWLASSSATNFSYMMVATHDGYVGSTNHTNNILGFRPIVCLNSSVTLEEVTDGYKIK